MSEDHTEEHSGTETHYETVSELAQHYETIAEFVSENQPSDLMKFNWYHGKLTEDQAEAALNTAGGNKFVVRQTSTNLLLSKSVNGWKSHDIIHRSAMGYLLEGKTQQFLSIPEMIAFYQQFPIDDVSGQTLGTAAARQDLIPGISSHNHLCF